MTQLAAAGGRRGNDRLSAWDAAAVRVGAALTPPAQVPPPLMSARAQQRSPYQWRATGAARSARHSVSDCRAPRDCTSVVPGKRPLSTMHQASPRRPTAPSIACLTCWGINKIEARCQPPAGAAGSRSARHCKQGGCWWWWRWTWRAVT